MRLPSLLSLAFSLSLSLSPRGVSAFFRLPLDNVLVTERTDPIVSPGPGQWSAHVHSISGGSAFGPDATYETLRASECTSAQAVEDKSAYWTPQLFFQWKNGSFSAVPQLNGGLIYYLFRNHSSDASGIEAFPPGFRMFTGDPTWRSYSQQGAMKDAIGWNCLGSGAITRVEGSGLPKNKVRFRLPPFNLSLFCLLAHRGSKTTPKRTLSARTQYCADNLRGEIRFPSCWNGTPYSPDMSHVAYSDGESGPCPATHPRRLVTLFFEINYYVQAFEPFRAQAADPAQPFVLAMGDATGHGWHGDFFNGWPQDLLQKAIDTCTYDSGVIEECKVLKLYDRSIGQKACRRTPIWDEARFPLSCHPRFSALLSLLFQSVNQPLKALPGCNKITKTQAQAKAQMAACKEAAPKELAATPTVYTGDVPPPGTKMLKGLPTTVVSASGYKYQGCYKDNTSSRTFAKQLTTSLRTIAACLSAAKKGGWAYAGLEHGGECWVSKSAPRANRKIDYSRCSMLCDGNAGNFCGGNAAMTVYKAS
ncbi:hypothetical protein JCM10213_008152 [Rhodosporidiobolus nylandii]